MPTDDWLLVWLDRDFTFESRVLGKAAMPWIKFFVGALLAIVLPGIAGAAEIEGSHILLPAKERQVKVTYFRAPGEAPRPSVLLLHGAMGFDAQIANYDRYCSELASNGMDAYLVYYYSFNDQRSMTSGTDVFVARFRTWARLVDDLADDLLAERQSNGRVGLIGFSNGAILASGASALDSHITAAVIYYGGVPFPMNDQVTRFPPLLILHGDADTIIPVGRGKELASFAKRLGGTADLVIYPGAGHGFGSRLNTNDGTDALARTVTFLAKELDAHLP
jgi:carboxymethylenebutenolidase